MIYWYTLGTSKLDIATLPLSVVRDFRRSFQRIPSIERVGSCSRRPYDAPHYIDLSFLLSFLFSPSSFLVDPIRNLSNKL